MRVRRRQHHHRIDRRIGDGACDIGGGGKAVAVGDVLQPRLAARRGPHHADAIGEIDQAARVRLQRVAQTDDGNADHGALRRIADRLRLRLQREPADVEGLPLRHRRLGAVRDVVEEVAVVGHRQPAAIDVARRGPVGDEHVVGAFAPLDVEVLAQFQRALGADDEEPAVAPGRQAVRREPVEPDVAAHRRRRQHEFGKILEAWRLGAECADAARDDLGIIGFGEGEELVDRVHADVVDDAAIGRRVEEPRRPQCAVQPMRRRARSCAPACQARRSARCATPPAPRATRAGRGRSTRCARFPSPHARRRRVARGW